MSTCGACALSCPFSIRKSTVEDVKLLHWQHYQKQSQKEGPMVTRKGSKPRCFLMVGLVFLTLASTSSAQSSNPVKQNLLQRDRISRDQLSDLASLGDNVVVDWNTSNGTPVALSGSLGSVNNANSVEEAAIAFITEHKVLFKLKDPGRELSLHSQKTDEMGYVHLKYNQQVDGVPVWGSQLGVHVNSANELYYISGSYHPSVDISTIPTVLELDAKRVAMEDRKRTESRPIDSRATLVVFPWEGKFFLCWKVEIFGTNPSDIYWQYFVDATTAAIVFKYNDIHFDGPSVGTGLSQDGTMKSINTYLLDGKYYLHDVTKPMNGFIATYDAWGDSTENPSFGYYFITDGDNIFSESPRYPAGIDLHRNLGIVYDYYYSKFGRNSWDDMGAKIEGVVHYNSNLDNAFWDPNYKLLLFGDGNTMFYRLSYSLDVVAHEFTHAITGATADLYYHNQSGALNESFSDIMAAALDSADWEIGEDCTLSPPYYLRSLSNPGLGGQPMVMSEYVFRPDTEEGDNGGVHTNSGIPNYAAYLVATKIGREKMSRVFFKTLESYLLSSSNFLSAYNGCRWSATQLYGSGSPEVTAVDFAFDSVGIAPAGSYNEPPVLTNPGNKSITENGTLSFTLSASDPDNNPLTFSASGLPSGATLNSSSGYFNWRPSVGQAGDYPITFTVSDGKANDQESIIITVTQANRPPVLANIGNKLVDENAICSFTVSATDQDNDPISYSSTTLPTGAVFSNSSGDFYWQPSYLQAGVYNLTITASDGQATDQEAIQITVINVNRAPVLANPGNKTVAENAVCSFTIAATDQDNDPVSYSVIPLPTGAVFSNSSGDFYWQPTYVQAGTYDLTFSATDGQATDQQSMQILVTNTNRPPASFDLTGPVDNDTVRSASALLRWRHAVDPDIGDVMNYTLYYSTVDTSTWQHTVTSVVDSQYTLGSLEENKKYFWKVVAQDNAGATSQCTKAFSFVAADVTPPSFVVDVLMNPVLPFELDLYFYPTEPLGGSPEVTIVSPSGSNAQTVTQLSNRDAACYLTDYHVGPSGSYTITVCGTDPSSNRGCKNENFSASRVFVNSGVELESPRGAIRLSIPAGWARDNGLVVYKERTIGPFDLALMNIPIDVTPILIVDLTATVPNSNKLFLLTVDAQALDFSVDNGRTVVLVSIADMSSRLIPTRINVSTGEYIAEVSELGSYVIGVVDINKLEVLPSAYRLDQNSPNPFNGWTEIPFITGEQAHVTVDVFNVLGQRVATLADLDLPAGSYSISWDGRTDAGEECGSGTYFYRLTAGSHVETKKMLYLK